MGFEPQIREIIEDFEMPQPGAGDDERQTMMFSATFPSEIQDMALDFLDPGYLWVAIGRVGCFPSTVEQRWEDVRYGDKFEALVQSMQSVTDSEGDVARTIIFANQKATVDDVCWRLGHERIRARPIHGGLSQGARTAAIRDLKDGRVQALVATDVASRGLDLPGIDHVVNYDMPLNADDYVHRIGRTGRIGNNGVATSLVSLSDFSIRDIVRALDEAANSGENVAPAPEWLQAMGRSSNRSSIKRYGTRQRS
mmetsp:Transcript_78026/g.242395  ORF Transcript_78026/g.242395 Transcript_78026/m.242395 type:complete len:253 (+) Transcript_78026:1-759(+)